MSSGTAGLWRVDALELRRQQRFEQVLSCHVDAIRRSRRTAAAPTEAPAYRSPWVQDCSDPRRPHLPDAAA
ncbi:hypothetical protein [Streptomyces yangpuensis]